MFSSKEVNIQPGDKLKEVGYQKNLVIEKYGEKDGVY